MPPSFENHFYIYSSFLCVILTMIWLSEHVKWKKKSKITTETFKGALYKEHPSKKIQYFYIFLHGSQWWVIAQWNTLIANDLFGIIFDRAHPSSQRWDPVPHSHSDILWQIQTYEDESSAFCTMKNLVSSHKWVEMTFYAAPLCSHLPTCHANVLFSISQSGNGAQIIQHR